MEGLIMLILMMILIMNLMKMIFSEMDGRRANKQYNIRYFLQFTKPFSYGRTSYIVFVALVIFLFTATEPIFSMAWLLEFVLLLCVAVIVDVVSQYAAYFYTKKRFKAGIDQAVKIHDTIKSARDQEDPDNIIYPDFFFNFNEIVESHMKEEEHIGIASMDGGEFVSSISNLSPITYVIDSRKADAEKRLEGMNVKVTSLTPDNGLPFKDEKIDTYICRYTNFNKADVLRILKPEGILLVHQAGSDNIKELNNILLPMNPTANWNKYACQGILSQSGFEILDGQEQIAKIGFRSMGALFTYLRRVSPEKVFNFEFYINQYALIEAAIRQRGFFELTLHEFYLICKKIG